VDDQSNPKRRKEALTECKQKVEELKEENKQLRNAAETFCDLAERLNEERRAAKGLPPNTGIADDEKSPHRRRHRN
jgi:predicted RNase H-like nuclease (RuvC/YqgF family)